MAYSFKEFPSVSYNDADLRELIRLYNELLSIYEGLKQEMQNMLDYIDTFEETTDEKIKEQITVTMSLYTQRLIKVETLMQGLEVAVKSNAEAISKFQPQIDALTQTIKDQKYYLMNLNQELREEFHQYKNGTGEYIDGRLDAFETKILDMVTKLDKLDVVNPMNGNLEDINKVLDDIYNAIQLAFGLRAEEYDKLQLTALEYDKMRIKAIDYDTKSFFLFWNLTAALMFNPFTGKQSHYSVVINRLADLHKCTFTAKQYDELQCTAIDYDAWNINAFNYDWFGMQMILKRQGITAEDYDKQKITAEKYDNEKIIAYRYDTYGNSLFKDVDTTTSKCMSCNPDVLQPIPNK